MTTTSEVTATGVDERSLRSLRRWNLALTALHLGQAVAVVVLATDFAITITQTLPTGPPGSAPASPESLVDLPIGATIAVFLLMASLDHLLTATVARRTYERDLRGGINRFRWVEYSFSATIMVVLIALYSGIVDISALIGIVGANVAMILFGWLQESANPPGSPTRTMKPFWFGCVAGAAPWIAIAANLVAAEEVPGFVIGIFVSLFVFFNSFALNQWLQYRGIGPWRSYAFGEKAYLVLSLVAKSALAWQIFAGSLAS
ncbi:heliorhodopsin HeR [Nocardioides sp. zg-1230]|uniref:heliorhodopsin HeR n=1 Tax=Nocardioides sp. zg-1230 TaxID=2736601 RepID=UPI001552C8FF|nr:heliorhodopsin HeR [Nocardioides sp. zg-1230]NPC41577.1 heliorhodopsin HeR [Nocardioides sp. zg-1230]